MQLAEYPSSPNPAGVLFGGFKPGRSSSYTLQAVLCQMLGSFGNLVRVLAGLPQINCGRGSLFAVKQHWPLRFSTMDTASAPPGCIGRNDRECCQTSLRLLPHFPVFVGSYIYQLQNYTA